MARVSAPAWLRRDHPLVVRELAALPDFLGKDGNLALKVGLFILLAFGLAPCNAICFGGISGLIKPLLSLMPLLWGAQTINREREAHTWDSLRVTPYSSREIVLAKFSAVLYRLSPVLAFLLINELLTTLFSLGFSSFMFFSGSVNINGSTLRGPDLAPGTLDSAALLLLGVALLATLSTVLLGFITSVMAGMLASALTLRRGMAYLGAVTIRASVALVLLVINGGLALLLSGSAESGLPMLFATAFMQPLLSIIPGTGIGSPITVAVYALLLPLIHTALLIGLVWLTTQAAMRETPSTV